VHVTDVILFHHACGLTEGMHAFAGELRAAGHTVTAPDLYDGATFTTVEDGVAHARKIGFDTVVARGQAAADELPDGLVYLGFSLGVMPAQALAQNRPGAKGAVFLHGCLPPAEFGSEWPAGVPLQIHGMADDEFFAEDEAAARALVDSVDGAELFVYPGDKHLFTDSSLPDYDQTAAAQVKERVLAFLAAVS
jgi:dienelactone hydrolase